MRAAIGTGVLGAYTTFSTFAVELTTLGRDGHVVVALAYAYASLVLGLVAALLGVACARLDRPRRTRLDRPRRTRLDRPGETRPGRSRGGGSR